MANLKGYLKDKNNNQLFADNNDYTTTEQLIGSWTNNKPIYRKTFTGTTASSAKTEWTNIFSLPNVDEIIDLYGCTYHNNEKQPLPRYEDSNFYLIFLYAAGYIRYRCNGFLNNTFKLTIEYTKTTD